MPHFVLIKRECLDRRGRSVDAGDSALALLHAGVWPLWRGTPNRKAVAANDEVAVYLAGPCEGRVIAKARVAEVAEWTRDLARSYPLMLDGTPDAVLRLDQVMVFARSIDIRRLLPQLSFVPAGQRKWGVHFTGGMRALGADDFKLMTT